MTAAIAIVPLILAVGTAIDFANAFRVKSHLRLALDTAIVSAAAEIRMAKISETEAKARAEAFFWSNAKNLIPDDAAIQQFDINQSGSRYTVDVTATASSETAFMHLAGIKSIPVSVTAQSTFTKNKVEIALVLDGTASMQQNGRADALRAAAENMINVLFADPENADLIRVSIVPYGSGVYLQPYTKQVTDGLGKNCATERMENRLTDAYYTVEPVGNDRDGYYYYDYCTTMPIVPLTSDKDQLINAIREYDPTGDLTNGAAGVAWGWYTLSPNWNPLWPADSQAADYNSDTLKIMVVMTDGSFNQFWRRRTDGTGHYFQSSHLSAARARGKEICAAVKDASIRLYSVAFQAPATGKEVMLDCASKPDLYYEAEDQNEIRNAFQEIADNIFSLYISM